MRRDVCVEGEREVRAERRGDEEDVCRGRVGVERRGDEEGVCVEGERLMR